MTATDYLESKVLDHVLGIAGYTAPSALYLCLHTDDPSESGNLNQVIGGSYAPQLITFAGDNFANRLTNPGFDGTVGPGIAAGWTSPIHPVTYSPSIMAGGYQRLSTTFVAGQNVMVLQQRVTDVTALVGQVVVFRVSTRNPGSGSGDSMVLTAKIYNISGTLLYQVGTGWSPHDAWASHMIEFSMPTTGDGASYADVYIEMNGSVTSGVDLFEADDAFFGLQGSNQRPSLGTIIFPNMPGVTVSHFAIREASTTGPAIFSGQLSFNRSVTAGDPLVFGPGQIVVRAD